MVGQRRTPFFPAASLLLLATLSSSASLSPHPAAAQQVTSTMPRNYLSNGFYEMFGIHWGFRLNGPNGGVFFDNGGYGGVTPAFGGFDPNSAARFGFARGGTNGGFFFDFIAGQGSNRSMVTQAPILTLPNGGAGAFFDTQLTPFVTGWVPVVGQAEFRSPLDERLARLRQGDRGGARPESDRTPSGATPLEPSPADFTAVAGPPPATLPAQPDRRRGTDKPDDPHAHSLALRRPAPSARAATGGPESPASGPDVPADGQSLPAADSTATRGDESVAEIRRRQAQLANHENDELEQLVAQARAAEAQGKLGVARIFYQQAARRCSGPRQRELESKAREVTR